MFIDFSKIIKKKPEKYLVLDIGTSEVKSLVFQKDKNYFVVLASSSSNFSSSPLVKDEDGMIESKDFSRDIIKKTILEAKELLGKEFQNNYKKILISLPADVLRGRVSFQNFHRKQSEKIINKIEEKKIFDQIFKKAKKEISEDFSKKTGIMPKEFSFLDIKILDIKIDGYETPKILGYKGNNLEFNIFITVIVKHRFDNFKKILKSLKLKPVYLIHQAEGLINVFAKEYPDTFFIDIGGYLTQIFLIKNGKLKKVKEFEWGGEDFSQAISQVLGVSKKRANLLKEKYSNSLLSENVRRRIKEIFNLPTNEWFFNLKSELLKENILLPSLVLIFGGSGVIPDIKEVLEKRYEELLFISEPEIKIISSKYFQMIKDNTNKLIDSKDVPILLTCWGLKD